MANKEKPLDNKDITSDIEVVGDPGAWKLVCKASSKKEKWTKSTMALTIPGGCLVQVTTQVGKYLAEAVTFVPGTNAEELIKEANDG